MGDDTKTNELAARLEELMATGSEAEVRAFIVENLPSFPEDVQRRLAVDLFAEALKDAQTMKNMKETAAQAIEEYEKEEGAN